MANFTRPGILLIGKAVFFLILFLPPNTAFSEFFKWVDREGNTHFSDDYLKIPGEYRDQIERRETSPSLDVKRKELKPVTKEDPAESVKVEIKEFTGEKPPQEGGEKVSILEKIAPTADKEGNVVFAGKIKNNSKELFNSVEIVFTLQDQSGKVLKTITSPITGKLEGILEGGETGTFEARTGVPINSMGFYKYMVNWKSFGQ